MTDLPDAEAVVINYLQAITAITAIAPAARISSRTPDDTVDPWVRVTQIDDAPAASASLWQVCHYLQFDCYGSNDPGHAHEEASLLARRVRAALHALGEGAAIAGAVVSTVGLGSARRLPDTELKPARERFVLDIELHIHPVP